MSNEKKQEFIKEQINNILTQHTRTLQRFVKYHNQYFKTHIYKKEKKVYNNENLDITPDIQKIDILKSYNEIKKSIHLENVPALLQNIENYKHEMSVFFNNIEENLEKYHNEFNKYKRYNKDKILEQQVKELSK